MRHRIAWLVLLPIQLLSACGPGSDRGLEANDQKASYAIGLRMGSQLIPAGERLDRDAFRRGFEDALAGRAPALPEDTLRAALREFSQSVIEATNALRGELAAQNEETGEAFRAENAAREGVITRTSGVQLEVIREGSGPSPAADDSIRVRFRGMLIDGTVFNGSADDGEPVTFATNDLVPRLREAVPLMSVGGTYRVVIPPDLGYGISGMGRYVGPNATLVFEIELLGITE